MTSTTSARAAGAAISTAEPARAAAVASTAVRFCFDTVPSFLTEFLTPHLTAYQIGRQGTPGALRKEDTAHTGVVAIRRARSGGGDPG
ncbi:hypothetical protein GCM10018780_43490 [Streptomyces lanatus]|nr:hypothetical protein GCM10018780_43490 [Streptomyces lanatus]